MVCVVGAGREVGRQAGSSEELLEAQPHPLSAGLGNTRVLTDLSCPLALWALDDASLMLPS